ncbi:MAG: dihydrodipicolinate synthase family protein [Bacteroidales bacterium]|nr:dihydrodipicolinate synthase family protein [Bacteroidales bacterium]
MKPLKIKGIITPMVTPLLDNDTIDAEGARALADHLIEGGVSAIFLLGTTGEAQSISERLRKEFICTVTRHVAGRVPVLVAVTDTSMEESIELARHAKECGADALVAAAPYYFPGNQKELVRYYKALADKLPLPLFLYNMPSKVKVFLNVDSVLELSKHPNIIGIKDSSANMSYFVRLIHYFAGTDFSVYMGPEEQTSAAVLLGADGGVNGGSNLYPELFVSMYKAAERGDLNETRRLQDRIMSLSEALYNLTPDSDGSFACSIKCALYLKGIIKSSYMAYPFIRFDKELEDKVKTILGDLDSKGYK